jgi:hypothetical protein
MRWPWRRKPPENIGLWQILEHPWWERGPLSYQWPPVVTPPDGLVCYGCGRKYNPVDVDKSQQHTHHGGDTGLPREALLCWLEMCQRERDWIARTLAEQGRRAVP